MNVGNIRASKKQQEVYDFIRDFIRDNGYGPSYREIKNGLNYASVSTVAVHVDSLISKGYLRKSDKAARSLEIVGDPTTAYVRNGEQFVVYKEAETAKRWLEGEATRRVDSLTAHSPQQRVREAKSFVDVLELIGSDAAMKLLERVRIYE